MSTQSNNHDNRPIFINRFIVPGQAKEEFVERLHINQDYIKNLPGFVEDRAYQRTDEDGNLVCITVAVWEDEESLSNAKEAVKEEYQRQGFDPAEFFQQNDITAERGIFTKITSTLK
ncbi:antibiotic biosynthesis monooxygenase [Aliifodinibius sp. S!AR15-10]|uniref:antibiotic biosynthesis monooxygenase family protein n=1 Tax=Aliifodinibius sp. S!AR15-10 TaxID=2950437 RepID=UPI002861FC05|nr:antibiotic biosynthesis monooxygenase [Aliifodinibius sp. S!AR15-10]MDR8393760.1 antibiotic biosynthesis monooxygenase [Aliifodinibius sp. S!AR15-10]